MGSGGFSISWGKSNTSKTRSKLTIDVAKSTRTFESAINGPYSSRRYAVKATMVPIVNVPRSTKWPPAQNTSALPTALTRLSPNVNQRPTTAWRTPMSRTAEARRENRSTSSR